MTLTKAIPCAASITLFALGPSSNAQAQERPDLSGRWTLNLEESDDIREHVPWGESGQPQAGGGRPGMRGRPPSAGGRFGRGGGRPDPERVQQTMRLARVAHGIAIVHSDSMVTVTYDDGEVLALRTDGKKKKVKVEGGGDVEIKARWKNDDFVVERKVSGGGTVRETYLRPPDRNQMYVIVEIEIGPVARAAAFRRVYDLDTAP